MDLTKTLAVTIDKDGYTLKIFIYHLVLDIPLLDSATVHFMVNKIYQGETVLSMQDHTFIRNCEYKEAVYREDESIKAQNEIESKRREQLIEIAKKLKQRVPEFDDLKPQNILVSKEVKEKKDFTLLMNSFKESKVEEFLKKFIINHLNQ